MNQNKIEKIIDKILTINGRGKYIQKIVWEKFPITGFKKDKIILVAVQFPITDKMIAYFITYKNASYCSTSITNVAYFVKDDTIVDKFMNFETDYFEKLNEAKEKYLDMLLEPFFNDTEKDEDKAFLNEINRYNQWRYGHKYISEYGTSDILTWIWGEEYDVISKELIECNLPHSVDYVLTFRGPNGKLYRTQIHKELEDLIMGEIKEVE